MFDYWLPMEIQFEMFRFSMSQILENVLEDFPSHLVRRIYLNPLDFLIGSHFTDSQIQCPSHSVHYLFKKFLDPIERISLKKFLLFNFNLFTRTGTQS